MLDEFPIRAKAGGRLKRPLMRLFRLLFSVRRSMRDSARAARLSSRTKCCRRCDSNSVGTSRSRRTSEASMAEPVQSDALVFFGATGDLAYKKIFPSLQALVKHGKIFL